MDIACPVQGRTLDAHPRHHRSSRNALALETVAEIKMCSWSGGDPASCTTGALALHHGGHSYYLIIVVVRLPAQVHQKRSSRLKPWGGAKSVLLRLVLGICRRHY